MYKKYMAALLFLNLLAVAALFNITGIKVNRLLSTPAFKLELREALSPEKQTGCFEKNAVTVASEQRVLSVEVIEKNRVYDLSEEDYEVLLRIVEAEAGGEDTEGKMLVAGVVLNRVANEAFPDTVKEVVFQRNKGVSQFSPVYSGRYYRVKVSGDTVEAVERVLRGEDISEGALFFAARKYADAKKMRWFDTKLTFLFSHGGHEFFY